MSTKVEAKPGEKNLLSSKELTEEQIAGIADLYLKSKAWDVFPEVEIPIFGGRPDFVCTKGKLCLAAEIKKNLSYTVLEQLTRWHHAYKASETHEYQGTNIKAIPNLMVAVVAGVPSISKLKQELIKRYRLGLWSIFHKYETKPYTDAQGSVFYQNEEWIVVELIEAKIQPGSRQTSWRIVDHLNEDMKMGKAGTTGLTDSYMTPYKRTMNKVWDCLSSSYPGDSVHISKVVDYLNRAGGHHYTTDRGAISGILEGCKREGIFVDLRRVTVPDIMPNGVVPSGQTLSQTTQNKPQ